MFLNIKAMTDQELLETSNKINKRLVYASRFSCDDMLINQLRSIADACTFEAIEREQSRLFEMMNKNRKNETDLTPDGTTQTEKTNGKTSVKSSRSDTGLRTKRTSQPSKDT